MTTNGQVLTSTSPTTTPPAVTGAGSSRTAFQIWSSFLEFATFECLLTRRRLANGSGVIVLRSVLTALVIHLAALGLRNLLDSSRTWGFSGTELKAQLGETLHWYGAIFAAIYAGLYTRFASQWTYLANVYNQIKAAECRGGCDGERLAEWKAGFIEDAEELHLAGKTLFASVLREWGRDANVKKPFVAYAHGGEERFDALMKRVEAVWKAAGTKR